MCKTPSNCVESFQCVWDCGMNLTTGGTRPAAKLPTITLQMARSKQIQPWAAPSSRKIMRRGCSGPGWEWRGIRLAMEKLPFAPDSASISISTTRWELFWTPLPPTTGSKLSRTFRFFRWFR